MSSSKKTKQRKAGTFHYHYYACNSVQSGTCASPARVRKEDLDAAVEQLIDQVLGNRPVMERRQDATLGLSTELGTTKGRLERLEADYLAGRYDGEGQQESYWRMHYHLSSKVAGLTTTLAEQHGRREWTATERTYRQEWADKNSEQKRVFLQRHDIEVKVRLLSDRRGVAVSLKIPGIPGVELDILEKRAPGILAREGS